MLMLSNIVLYMFVLRRERAWFKMHYLGVQGGNLIAVSGGLYLCLKARTNVCFS